MRIKPNAWKLGKKGDMRRLGELQTFNNDGQLISVSEKAKDLGVIIDKHINFNDQINATVKVARFHLRNIAFIKKYLDTQSVKTLIHNQVINRLDYCNSLYYNLPKYQLK